MATAGNDGLGPLRFAGAALVLLVVAGCYTLRPLRGVEPQVGERVAFDVNDTGRVALGGSMGPEIAQVEGQLIEKQNGSYLVSVSNVKLLSGLEQVWTGEQVRLQRTYLGTTYQRRFSAGRSIAFGLAGAGGIAALFVGRSLLGSGSEDGEEPHDTVISRRIRP